MAGFEGALPLDAFDVCAANPAREHVAEPEAALKLVEELSNGQALRKIKLSNKSYGAKAAKAIAEKLASLRGVKDVDVSDVIAGRPEAEALEVLETLALALAKASGYGDAKRSRVTALDVSDNALGQKGLDALLPLFMGAAPLVHLKTCNNGMSSAAAHQLKDVLTSKGVTSLESFHYFNNMSGDDGAKAIAEIVQKSPDLTDLRFSGTRAGRAGSLVFAEALRARQLLVTVDLADNTFGTDGGQLLGEWLSAANGASPLEVLNVRDCSLGDDGFSELCSGLEKCDNLRSLDFSGNELTADAFNDTKWLASCASTLEVLQVEENEFSSRGAGRLAKGFSASQFPALSTFVCRASEIGSRGALVLARAVVSKAPSLKSLELDGNGLSDEALAELASIVPADVLGELEDNDEDLCDEDELDDADDVDELAAAVAGIAVA